jgi:hypothetical protein
MLSGDAYGVFFSALWVIAWPVAEMSSPAPAVVLQALSSGAAPSSTTIARAIEIFVSMVVILG